MRKILRRYMPDPESLRRNRWFAMLGERLFHPSLWHLNRRSAAGGVAIGMFCGLIPGPFQMLGSVIACLALRFNLPVALATTFYTNPFTIVPIYLVAYTIGSSLLGARGQFVVPPEKASLGMWEWIQALFDWLIGLGPPLALGLVVLACVLAVLGYVAVSLTWRWHLVRELKRRKSARYSRQASA